MTRRLKTPRSGRGGFHAENGGLALHYLQAPFVILLFSILSTSVADVARAGQVINWEPQSAWSTVTDQLGGQKVLISPGGTVYVVWSALNGISPGNPVNSGSGPDTICDSRLEFASNDTIQGCPDFLNDVAGLDTLPNNPPPVHARCPYYYLPDVLSSVYVRARYPDGTWAQVETVSVVTAVVAQETLLTDSRGGDAAIGPDGALHVVWTQRIPNLPVEAATYHDRGLLFNQCSEERVPDGVLNDADRIEWCVAAADSNDSCCAEPIDSLHVDTSPCTAPLYPCWRQLAPLHRICYRRRSPTGQWGPIYTNITPRSDPLTPLEARQALIPAITVDRDGMVHIVWGQKHEQFPSCAFWVNNRGSRAGIPFIGIPNVAMFDAFYRSWDGDAGPTASDSVYRVKEELLLPACGDSLDGGCLQSDWPVDILVTGSGNQKRIHLVLNYGAEFPTKGAGPGYDPPHGYLDAEVYTMSSDGGRNWTPRKHLTTHPRDALADSFPNGCMANSIGFTVNAPWTYVRLVEGENENVHAFYTHTDFEFIGGSGCSPGNCPLPTSCFHWRSYEQFHRYLGNGDSTQWWPADSLPANRLSNYGGLGEPCRPDFLGTGVYDATGTLHAFWLDSALRDLRQCHFAADTLYDSVRIYHAFSVNGLTWSQPDTVAAFWTGTHAGNDIRGISGLDVTELNGIFHVVAEYIAPNAGEVKYFRGVLDQTPWYPEIIQCDTSSSPACSIGSATCWAGTKYLCADYTIDQCDTLIIEPGTNAYINSGQPEIIVRGLLLAEGTASEPITMRVNPAKGPERATVGSWKGIRVCGGSARAVLRHTSISGAEVGVNYTPSCAGEVPVTLPCATADTMNPPGTLWADSCRFAYNEIAGLMAEGDALAATSDRVHIRGCTFSTNYEGAVLENVSAPNINGTYSVEGNRFLYNDLCGLQILGKYGRKLSIGGNLFQGLGADEFIPSLPDAQSVDDGIWYDESEHDGANGDTLRIHGNTFFRIEGAGVRLSMNQQSIPGFSKTNVAVGDTIEPSVYGNLFVRVGTGLDLSFPYRMLIRGNEFLYYGTGLKTTNHKPDLGGGTEEQTPDSLAANYFYVRDGQVPETDWPVFSGNHIDAPVNMAGTLQAKVNYWAPVTDAGPNCSPTDGYFQGSPIAIAPCLSTLPIIYPTLDRWNVMSMPLKQGQREGESAPMSQVPAAYRLSASFPNPSRGRARIEFDLPRPTEATELAIFDVQGRKVRVLATGKRAPGSYSLDWDGTDDSGRRVGSGVYFYRLRAGTFEETRRMVLLK